MRLRSTWYRRWFLLTERPRHRTIDLGLGVTCFVPLRGGGRGSIRVGNETKFGSPSAHRLGNGEVMLQANLPESEIVIGRDNWFNNNTMLCALSSIRVGDNCRIGQGVFIMDADFHEINPATRNRSEGLVRPVTIGNNVWIGSRTTVLKGVKIGDNSVIGAMSLVTKEVPENTLVGGVPARVIRKLE
ncbi:MAG: acyltransferase, left-handed parallel beta-helix (hexapeptide repeat) family [Pedosphaera sp.]|nr:acyltransferase, left-handed parallel beta-helix (hexapeptide repeat) family [Pedosphaera sp.]